MMNGPPRGASKTATEHNTLDYGCWTGGTRAGTDHFIAIVWKYNETTATPRNKHTDRRFYDTT